MSDQNTLAFRRLLSGLHGMSHDNNRDIYQVAGYPQELVTRSHFLQLFQRGDIATRIASFYPQKTWSNPPIVSDESDTDALQVAFDRLNRDFRLLHYLERADRVAGVGRFGVLFLGFELRGNERHEDPLAPGRRLMFLKPFGEHSVTHIDIERSPESPRFGLPGTYTLQNTSQQQASSTLQSVRVHHSRVIHLSEFLNEDEVYGFSVFDPIFNRLADLEKTLAGSAESNWANTYRGPFAKVDPDASFDQEKLDQLEAQIDEYVNKFRRVLVGEGFDATFPASRDVNPSGLVSSLMDIIAGAAAFRGIPKRILLGSERGELASQQDEREVATTVAERRNQYAAPAVLRPLIRMLIETGNLPQPVGEWRVEWPRNSGVDPLNQSRIGVLQAQALRAYADSPAAQEIMPVREFRSDILGLDPEPEEDVQDETIT